VNHSKYGAPRRERISDKIPLLGNSVNKRCIPPVMRFVVAKLCGAARVTPPFFKFAPILDQSRLGKAVCRRLVRGVLYA
jgi:hypothetical protein